jgi:hypothetical protein
MLKIQPKRRIGVIEIDTDARANGSAKADEDKGLGGGAWILMPNVVFALQPAENLSIYPFFRYVHSDAPRSFLVPDSGIPVPPGGNVDDAVPNTRAFNMEVMVTFGLQSAVMDRVSATPDYVQNFTFGMSLDWYPKFLCFVRAQF